MPVTFENHSIPKAGYGVSDIILNGVKVGYCITQFGSLLKPINESYRCAGPANLSDYADSFDDSDSLPGEPVILIFHDIDKFVRFVKKHNLHE